MLTFLLVWTVALGSLSILGAGMIFPELSRKNDLIWVGIGLFYALILWANTGNIGGGLLLGQTAGISMMVWLGWQTMTQRRELTAPDKKTPVPGWLQKILDTVTPLWEKAYGLVAGQLGIETTGELQEGTDTALSGFKSKALGFLDKLNAKPADSIEDTSLDAEEGEESDAIENADSLSEPSETTTTADVVVEVTPPEAEELEPPSDVAPSSTPDIEQPPTNAETLEDTANVEVETSADVKEHTPDEGTLQTEQDVAPIPQTEAVIENSQAAQAPDLAAAETVETNAPIDANVEEGSPESTEDQAEAREPEETGDDSEPSTDDQPEATAPEPEDATPPQEDSNWPPEPMD